MMTGTLKWLQFCFTAGFFFVVIGLAGVLFGLAKFAITTNAATIAGVSALAILAVVIVWLGLKAASTRAFLLYIAGIWLVSRAAVVMLFPSFYLPGDEAFFHNFVAKLLIAIPRGAIASLSNIYDYPVWFSRAFPVYLPLAVLFGPSDIVVARYMNVLLGGAQLLMLFFIIRMIAGSRIARFACLLFLVFPYHCINVLSYDPQVAGTFFLLIAVWMFLFLLRRRRYSIWQLTAISIGLGFALLFAGIQRGGIDLLLAAVMILATLCLWPIPGRRMPRRNLLVMVAALVVIWLPVRSVFGSWISSYDEHHLRSHALGFMTRGWNLETPGEYLPLYEQLDVVSPKPEKARLLESILVTEFARQPVRALLVLPIEKIAKLFAVGYASTAELGLELGGYAFAANVYRGLRSIYAPVVLALCAYGLLCCVNHRRLLLRLMLPVMLMAFSCAGIVILWETSPRYSHPFHFAILAVAALAINTRAGWRDSVRPLAIDALTLAAGWLFLSAALVLACRLAKPYLLVDPRSLQVNIDGTAAQVEPLHPLTKSWEGEIDIRPGTALPATVKIALPQAFVIHLWLPDQQQNYDVDVQNERLPSAASGRIERAAAVADGHAASSLTLLVHAEDGAAVARKPLRIGVGYILGE